MNGTTVVRKVSADPAPIYTRPKDVARRDRGASREVDSSGTARLGGSRADPFIERGGDAFDGLAPLQRARLTK